MLNKSLIEESDSEGVIIYFSNEYKPIHAGRFNNNRVLSKWGTGLVFNHEMFEAPISYGDNIRIYKFVDNPAMLDHFYGYAETKGIEFRSDISIPIK